MVIALAGYLCVLGGWVSCGLHGVCLGGGVSLDLPQHTLAMLSTLFRGLAWGIRSESGFESRRSCVSTALHGRLRRVLLVRIIEHAGALLGACI